MVVLEEEKSGYQQCCKDTFSGEHEYMENVSLK